MNTISLSTLLPAIYCRKSEESEERQVLSLPAQREEAIKLVSQFGIVKTVQYEEAKSAKVSGQRVAFAQMIKEIRRGKVNAIICWKLDRLARNMVEGGEIIDLLQQGVIKAIITPFKVYYPDENALLMAMEFGAANQYSRDLSQNVRRGQLRKAKSGFPTSRACMGFTNDRSGEKGEKKWLVDETRFSIVKQMFEMYLAGNYTGGQIHQWAVKTAKLTTPPHKRSGNKLIARSGVYRILRDPIYAGFFYLQGERYELAKDLPRIISEGDHYRILRMLGGKGAPKTKTHEVIYSGFIESPYNEYVGPDIKMQLMCDCKHKFSYLNKTNCPKCNAEIANLDNPKYLHYIYYRNVPKSKRQEPIKYVSEKKITAWLTEYVEGNLVFSTNFIDWCKRYIWLLNEHSNDQAIEENRQKRIHDLETKKTRYREMLADGLFSKEEYLSDVQEINAELASMQRQENPKELLDKVEEVFTVGTKLIKTFNSGTLADKRNSLSLLGANLIWNEKTLIIINKNIIQRVIDGLNEAKTKNDQFEPKTTLADKDETGVFASVRPILCNMCLNVRNILISQSTNEGE